LPEFQGKGIGKAFINYITDMAIQTGHDKLILKVFHKNEKANRFYERMGFYFMGEELTQLGNGYTVLDYIMKMDI
jgi:ribosomal protein S18 acetylase RimI-like enzyme